MSLTRLLKGVQRPIFYDQCLQVVNSVAVGIKREFSENCIQVSDIRQRVSD